jgi:hypothetical protein
MDVKRGKKVVIKVFPFLMWYRCAAAVGERKEVVTRVFPLVSDPAQRS